MQKCWNVSKSGIAWDERRQDIHHQMTSLPGQLYAVKFGAFLIAGESLSLKSVYTIICWEP